MSMYSWFYVSKLHSDLANLGLRYMGDGASRVRRRDEPIDSEKLEKFK